MKGPDSLDGRRVSFLFNYDRQIKSQIQMTLYQVQYLGQGAGSFTRKTTGEILS
jgi:hypothetical protein